MISTERFRQGKFRCRFTFRGQGNVAHQRIGRLLVIRTATLERMLGYATKFYFGSPSRLRASSSSASGAPPNGGTDKSRPTWLGPREGSLVRTERAVLHIWLSFLSGFEAVEKLQYYSARMDGCCRCGCVFCSQLRCNLPRLLLALI